MKKQILLFSILLFSLGSYAQSLENFYRLPDDLDETLVGQMIEESEVLLKGDIPKSWVQHPTNVETRLYSYHFTPSVKFNVENSKVYFWAMYIGWNSEKKGDLRAFYPPYYFEVDCVGERQRVIGSFDVSKHDGKKWVIEKRNSAWVKLQDNLKVNYCVELKIRLKKEIDNKRNFERKEKSSIGLM